MKTVRPVRRGCTILPILLLLLLLIHLLPSPARGANFATHGGLAQSTLDNDFFISGAMLADIDKFLPPDVPRTDSLNFALGLIERSRRGSNDLRLFAMGWYEHLDQDREFHNSVLAIQSVHPDYSEYDIRLGFDYLTITLHPTDVDVTFIRNQTEIIEAIQGGFTNITKEQIRQAIWDYVYSDSIEKPGLEAQIMAARLFAALFPEKVAGMVGEYNSYFERVTSSYYNPFLGDFREDFEKHTTEEVEMHLGIFLNIKKSLLGRRVAGNPPARA
ncbi:MAG: hypothetical protein ACE5KV_01550 [Thermoplasmata archaeon]